MRLRSLLLLSFASLVPAAALAAGAPFATPPQPVAPVGPPEIDAPPAVTPPVAAPPFDLVLPGPALDARSDLDVPPGPPDPLPSAEHPVAPPDLVGVVDLPDAADVVLGLAPPFGGELGGGHAQEGAAGLTVIPVPEPTTALLLLLGLSGFALRRR